MKLVKEHINEKFTKDSDPIDDMSIGTISAIEYSINLLKKLDNLEVIKSLYMYNPSIASSITTFLISIRYPVPKNLTIEYFKNLIVKSGLNNFLDLDDSIVTDSFREMELEIYSEIEYRIKEKYIKYFRQVLKTKY